MVGHYVGYTANAAIGVQLADPSRCHRVHQLSVFTGWRVLVKRASPARTSRTRSTAPFIKRASAAIVLASASRGAGGLFAVAFYLPRTRPCDTGGSAPRPFRFSRDDVQRQRRHADVLHAGRSVRGAADARTPLRLGVALTVPNIALNVMLILGMDRSRRAGTRGAAIGTSTASLLVSGVWPVGGQLSGFACAASAFG